jgi:hypothetical protein
MTDPTEAIRRQQVIDINSDPSGRHALEAKHGKVWDTTELQKDFDVVGFLAPFVIACRKSDGQQGSLMFQGSPRFYFSFQPE